MKYSDMNEIKSRGTPDFPIELYRVDSESSRYIMPFHWHAEFEIIRVVQGEFALMAGNTEHRLRAGDVALIGGGMIHGGTPENCVYVCVVFDPAMLYGKGLSTGADLLRVATDSRSSEISAFVPSDNLPICHLVDELIGALASGTSSDRLIVMGTLYLLFGELYRDKAVTNICLSGKDRFMGEQRLKTVLHWMEDNYSEEVTLEQLAAIAGMNPRYFCSFFKKYTHHSPIEYLNIYRIDSACRMLRMSNCTVTDAAFACGFNDLSYFVKTFKHYKGITPRQYQKGRDHIE